jgi:Pao retrotransposon peptidase/Family of unknown function (DUF5641)
MSVHVGSDDFPGDGIMMVNSSSSIDVPPLATISVAGSEISLCCFLDTGAQVSLITTNAINKLHGNVDFSPQARKRIVGFGGHQTNQSFPTVNIIFQNSNRDFSFEVVCVVVPFISKTKATPQLAIFKSTHPELQFATCNSDKDGQVDVLLGCNTVLKLINFGTPSPNPNILMTKLGCIPCGTISETDAVGGVNLTLEQSVEKLWDVEQFPDRKPLNDEERFCERIFNSTTVQLPSGRLRVNMPLISDTTQLGNSFPIALKRLYMMESNMKRNDVLRQRYQEFMREYEELGHMEQIPESEITTVPSYYYPHHGVTREAAVTTKLRVVFDGAAKPLGGLSINQISGGGRLNQRSIFEILTTFRTFKVAINADVEKMYRCIDINRTQCDLQRILWRDLPTQPVKHFRLLTVTYGWRSAPHIAVDTLKWLSQYLRTVGESELADIIDKAFYMDDLMWGADDIDKAAILAQKIYDALLTIRFHLRKWSSNFQPALARIAPEDWLKPATKVLDGIPDVIKTLGLKWNLTSDTLSFNAKWTIGKEITKRQFLSEIARVYDPLGLLNPLVVEMRKLFQELWRVEPAIEWDDNIPSHINHAVHSLFRDISIIQEVAVPRWIGVVSTQKVEIHGFCDASGDAYGGVVYVVSDSSAPILLSSKVKISPIKKPTIPRLELMGATLLAKLVVSVTAAIRLGCSVSTITCWTDSEIVIDWLKNPKSDLSIFINNRIGIIQELIPDATWIHVATDDNPADCLSRGLSATALKDHPLWWNGPSFLGNSCSRTTYSKNRYTYTMNMGNIQSESVSNNMPPISFSQVETIVNSYSSIFKSCRILGWILRLLPSHSSFRKFSSLQVIEIQHAMNLISKWDQQLLTKQQREKLKSWNLIEVNGLIRANTRLVSLGNPSAYQPIVLNNQGVVIKKLLHEYHRLLLHGTIGQMLILTRQKFICFRLRSIIRRVRSQCSQCRRFEGKEYQPQLAPLPAARTILDYPFGNCGVDYAGPLRTKLTHAPGPPKLRMVYIVLFCCMGTRAIHLELATDASTSAFLAAFKRFVARRGHPKVMFSDNGTNFVGASRQILESATECELHPEFQQFFINHSIEWRFNPPSAPSFGGAWESLVKSVKYHLYRVMGSQLLTFEEFNTLIIEIEGVVNSRPLGVISDDSSDAGLELTPSHFLIGRALTVPHSEIIVPPEDLRSKWNNCRSIARGFWNRWKNEYISQLATRKKNQSPTLPPTVGQLVFIKSENTAPTVWPKGIITELINGPDNVTRIARVKTANGNLLRPLLKLVALELNPATSNDHSDI